MFSKPTPSEPRLSPAAVVSDDMLSAPTPPWHSAFISQPATPTLVVALQSVDTFDFWVFNVWPVAASLFVHGYKGPKHEMTHA